MKKILTADNTETFLNEQVGESYHSQTGAVEEALKKYAIPCKIKELAKEKNHERDEKEGECRKRNKIRILDMFFGMGYNSAMAIDVALKENPNCEIEVIGIENDPEIIDKIQEINPPIKFFKHYKKLKLHERSHEKENHNIKQERLEFTQDNVSVKVLLGDAREMVKQLPENHFDAVFYDPFSPKTDPEMWTIDLFKEMWRVMKSSAVLATYSCARVVRENMSKAGLFYDDGPIVGRRGPGTIATKWEE